MLAQATPAAGGLSTTTWIIIALAVIVVAIAVAVAAQRRRSQTLRDRFGPEYERTVAQTGSRQRAEAELGSRLERHKKLDIRPLAPGARDRYAETWRSVQARFVDDPGAAIRDADALVNDVMRDRGYPVEDPDQRFTDLSVEHGKVLDNYRDATAIARENERGDADTETLRRAMVSYRALFADLLGADPTSTSTSTSEPMVEGRIVEPRTTDRGARA